MPIGKCQLTLTASKHLLLRVDVIRRFLNITIDLAQAGIAEGLRSRIVYPEDRLTNSTIGSDVLKFTRYIIDLNNVGSISAENEIRNLY